MGRTRHRPSGHSAIRPFGILDPIPSPVLWPRAILHADLDAFFASVEQLDEPSLRGKPVLVGGRARRGVVAAASYEARAFGCRSAMPTARALELCPHAVVVKPRFERYTELSRIVREAFERATPVVEPLSIDEAFLDVTASQPALGDPTAIAHRLKRDVRDTVGLTISVGVAPNKFLAKLATDLQKPDGLTVLGPDPALILDRIAPLPASRLPGIGPAADRRLAAAGVRSIADLRARDDLDRLLGPALARRCAAFARGLDDRPVVPDRAAKSIGHEQTFHHDIADPDRLRAVLLSHVERVARRLRARTDARGGPVRARGVSLKLRLHDFTTLTRAATLPAPTHATDELHAAARALLDEFLRARPGARLRLLGFTCEPLTDAQEQLPLFADAPDPRRDRLDRVADAVAGRFGPAAIFRAGSMDAR